MIYAAHWANERSYKDGPDEGMKYYLPEQGRLAYADVDNPQGLATFYPDAQLVTEEEMEKLWTADGWHYPGEHDTYSPYICNCCDLLTLEPDSRYTGRNVPHGAPFTLFYECKTCDRQYARQMQELQFGWNVLWSFRPNGTGHFERCEEPDSLPNVNPYGLQEVHLVKTKVEVKKS